MTMVLLHDIDMTASLLKLILPALIQSEGDLNINLTIKNLN